MAKHLPSKKQHALLEYIAGFIKSNGYGPSYREIMRALDYKSVSTVAVHVDGLITRGYLIKRNRSARSLELVNSRISEKPVDNVVQHPHEEWLLMKIQTKIDEYHHAPSASVLQEVRTLLDTLTILQLHDSRQEMERKLRTSPVRD